MNANLLTINRLPKSPYFVGHLPTNYSVHIEPATSVHYGLGGPRSEGFFVMSTSKLQRYVSEKLSFHFGGFAIYENTKPKWLCMGDGSRLELDFYLPDAGVAIEVQGEQHYQYVPHFHKTYENFRTRLKRDEFKVTECLRRGVRLFHITNEDDWHAVYDYLARDRDGLPDLLVLRNDRMERVVASIYDYARIVSRHDNNNLLTKPAERALAKIAKQYGLPKSQIALIQASAALGRNEQTRRRKKRARRFVELAGYVFVLDSTSGKYRIGHSSKPEQRAKDMRHMVQGHECWLIEKFPADNMRLACKRLHKQFAAKRYKGYWFNLDTEDIDFLRTIQKYEEGTFVFDE